MLIQPMLVLVLVAAALYGPQALYGATSFGPAITFNIGWQL